MEKNYMFLLILNAIGSYSYCISKKKKRYKLINNSEKGRKHVKEMLRLLQQLIKQITVRQLVKEALKGKVTEVDDIEWHEKR